MPFANFDIVTTLPAGCTFLYGEYQLFGIKRASYIGIKVHNVGFWSSSFFLCTPKFWVCFRHSIGSVDMARKSWQTNINLVFKKGWYVICIIQYWSPCCLLASPYLQSPRDDSSWIFLCQCLGAVNCCAAARTPRTAGRKSRIVLDIGIFHPFGGRVVHVKGRTRHMSSSRSRLLETVPAECRCKDP